MCIFEFSGGGGGPRHLHYDQDEWIYVIEGEFDFEVGDKRFLLGAGECVFMPRKVAHVWGSRNGKPGKIIDVYQPAGKMEEFFREVARAKYLPSLEEVVKKTYTDKQLKAIHQLFDAHGMDLLGPPILGEWKREESPARQAS